MKVTFKSDKEVRVIVDGKNEESVNYGAGQEVEVEGTVIQFRELGVGSDADFYKAPAEVSGE